MKNLFRALLAFLLLATYHLVTCAQSQGPMLLETPTLSRTKIAFSFAGDIWTVDRSGGAAQRLTTSPGEKEPCHPPGTGTSVGNPPCAGIVELQAHYSAYLPNIKTRVDLNALFKEMFSHLSVSHLAYSGGDVSVPQGEVNETVGLLGADIEVDGGRYRIKRILRGDNTRQIFSPLAQPVVGTRTSGWGIGATSYSLIDRGSYQIPDWGWYDARTGEWFIENRGIAPDYELETTPSAFRAGRDPQLEKAVELAMDALKRTKTAPIKRPTYPIYK